MALLTTYGDTNKQVEDGLQETVTDIYTQSTPVLHLRQTVATERFRYVGMTYAAANTCQAAMKSAYPTSDVRWYPVGGSMWEVSVSRNETSVELIED